MAVRAGRPPLVVRSPVAGTDGDHVFLLSCHWPKLVPAQAGSVKCPGVWGWSPQEHRNSRRRHAQFETEDKRCVPEIPKKSRGRLDNGLVIDARGIRPEFRLLLLFLARRGAWPYNAAKDSQTAVLCETEEGDGWCPVDAKA